MDDLNPTSINLSTNSSNGPTFIKNNIDQERNKEINYGFFSGNKFWIPYKSPKKFLNKKRKETDNLFVTNTKKEKKEKKLKDLFGNEISKNKWTYEENLKLFEAIIKYGNQWKQIETYVGSRTMDQLYSRTQKLIISIKNYGKIKGFDFENISMTNLNDLIETIKTVDENIIRFLDNMYKEIYEFKIEKSTKIKPVKKSNSKMVQENDYSCLNADETNFINNSFENTNYFANLTENNSTLIESSQRENNKNTFLCNTPNNIYNINSINKYNNDNFKNDSFNFEYSPYNNYYDNNYKENNILDLNEIFNDNEDYNKNISEEFVNNNTYNLF